jgi:uncharacterized protein YjaZ
VRRAATRRGCRSFAFRQRGRHPEPQTSDLLFGLGKGRFVALLPIVPRRRTQTVVFIAALALARPGGSVAQVHAQPDSARIVTADVARFWNVVDHATTLDLIQSFQRDYLDAGSLGLRIFAPTKLGNALDLATQVYNERVRYDSVRAATLRAGEAEPGIRAAYARLNALYDNARFPDVYFLVGRFIVGGWAADSAIIIATEQYHAPNELVASVAHELVHVQQPEPSSQQTLLERAFTEGTADFIGELISGATTNARAQAYGRAHERELWREFQRVMNGHEFAPWLYELPPNDRPRDLGYFIGYRIAEAYYKRAADKHAALRELIRARNVKEILERSGYAG